MFESMLSDDREDPPPGLFLEIDVAGDPPDYLSHVYTPSFQNPCGITEFDLAINQFISPSGGEAEAYIQPPAEPPDIVGDKREQGQYHEPATLQILIGPNTQTVEGTTIDDTNKRNDNTIRGPMLTAFKRAIKSLNNPQLEGLFNQIKNFKANFVSFEKLFLVVQSQLNSGIKARKFFLSIKDKVLGYGKGKYRWNNPSKYETYVEYCQFVFKAYEIGADSPSRMKILYENNKYLKFVAEINCFKKKLEKKKQS